MGRTGRPDPGPCSGALAPESPVPRGGSRVDAYGVGVHSALGVWLCDNWDARSETLYIYIHICYVYTYICGFFGLSTHERLELKWLERLCWAL